MTCNTQSLHHHHYHPPSHYNFNAHHSLPTPTSSTDIIHDDQTLHNAYFDAFATLGQQQPPRSHARPQQSSSLPLNTTVRTNPGQQIGLRTPAAATSTYLPLQQRQPDFSQRIVATSGASHHPPMYSTQNSMGGLATQHRGVKRTRSHQRTPSASTVASNGPASPYMQTASYPHVVPAETSPDSPAYHQVDQSFAKNLPTPSHTPTESVFTGSTLAPSQLGSWPNAHLAMKDFAIQHHSEGDYHTDFAPSRQSMSSYGNDSPATPQSAMADMDTKALGMPPNGRIEWDTTSDFMDSLLFDGSDVRHANPNVQLFRTESQAFQDELYNPHIYTSAPSVAVKPQSQNQFLSPNRSIMAERLQTANLARSSSPTSAISRERSPFRDGSPLAPTKDWRVAGRAAGTAAQMRQQQKEQAEHAEYARHPPQLNREPTKTISPKDALLDYHETDQPSLFQENLPVGYDNHRGGTEQWSTNYSAYGGLPSTSQQGMRFRQTATDNTSYPESGYEFQLPPHATESQIHSNPFQNNYQAAVAARMNNFDSTPDFPAPLPSMETSISDVGPGPSSQEDISTSMPLRPADTRANTGTYTCTYQSCTQRFDSHTNLQKHKREAHREAHRAQQPAVSTSPSASGSLSPRSTQSPAPPGRGMSPAAILARNSQAGPHKCERINPSTGKPCNTIFSRPYDLTRHEDTIHNNRKQKVKCPYCREEKAFSRTDALTRHLRVVHPNVESYGKRARRGD